ncbi:MAG: ABC-three component system middle component 6 [Paludibacteraceae bacterium]|nr:ABC-three component system middle component 6 [Paludibacteraceae bacterium]
MILPTKHTNLSESILGLSGYLLTFLKQRPYSVDELWNELENHSAQNYSLYKNHTFDNVIFAIDLLFMIGVVNMNGNGKICLV